MLAVPEDASEMRLWGTPPSFGRDSSPGTFSPSLLETGVAAEVECGQDGEDSFWCSESTSAASSAASSEYNSDNGLVDIEEEDVKRHLFSDSSSLNNPELERKCRELKAIDTSWRKCRRKRSPKRENSSKKTLKDILKQDWLKNNKNLKSENTFKCPCQKLKDSMEFTVSWKKMSSDDQVQAVEILTRVASVTMGLKEQMDIIRIINPQATVLPTDTEFEIDLDAFDDAKFRRIHSYSMDHLSRYSCPLCSDSQSETCRQNTNFSHRKHSKRKASGNLSMKKISRKSSKHKELLKRVHRQMMKEQRSGLFENEEVISLSSRNEEESNDLEVDILC
ncbi:protein FAM199X-like isoform X1 [Montipora capricornis]|uniref:protein FAM199X-like isoform X1 n=1 Tax=Montipora capricornis TaxID=246305 RepID=UPI0035F1C13E